MALLERETQLRDLHQAVTDAASGRGRTVLVAGEAGIGKTALVEQFTDELTARARVLRGTCEALFTPRPLGAFHDLVHALGGPLLEQLQADVKPIDLFHGLLEVLRKHNQPSAIVLEDLHWADDATLDFIRFVARRITRSPVVLVLTYRDDEIGADHPLAAVLGELPPDGRLRLKLPPLSRVTVEQLAREAGRHTPGLYRITGGNPFFITEVLHGESDTVAPSVREAVLARTRHLSDKSRALLDLVSVVPDRVEIALLERALGPCLDALEECAERGLLHLDAEHAAFRHELARMAVEEALSPVRRVRLNRTILEALIDIPPNATMLTRLAHHAIAAKDAEAIVRYVPQAAKVATARHSHREAAALLAAALPHVDRLAPQERAEFFEQRAQACILVDQGAEAIAMSEAAGRIWDELGDDFAKGRNLASRFHMGIYVRHQSTAQLLALNREAIALLERFGPSLPLAVAYASVGTFSGVESIDESETLRARAIEIAEALADATGLVEIMNGCSTSEWMTRGAPEINTVERYLAETRALGNDPHVITDYLRLAWALFRSRELDHLERCASEGVQFARERELDRFMFTYTLERLGAEAFAARTKWDEAERCFDSIASRPGLPWWTRLVHCLLPLALIKARRGQPFDANALDNASNAQPWLLSNDVFALHRAATEICWLQGRATAAAESARIVLHIATRWKHPWVLGDALLWCRMLCIETGVHSAVAEPYALLSAGDTHGAAGFWERRGYPYEAGLALASGDDDAQREALRIFDAVGAHGTASRVRAVMRERGVKGIPKGPQPTTMANPVGLTDREFEVLDLLAKDLSNATIASRLHRSIRTVENHVAAITGKFGAESRQQAVAMARARGVLPAA